MTHKLQESWHGPYRVEDKVNRVDYRIDLGKGRKKVLHINNMKRFHEREETVMRVTVVAEDWEGDVEIGTKLSGRCEDFDMKEIDKMRDEYPAVFSDLPGRTGVCKLQISTGEAQPVASAPYRIPDRLKEGVRSEVEKLVEQGIVIPSTSPWASPVVPVPKADGTI